VPEKENDLPKDSRFVFESKKYVKQTRMVLLRGLLVKDKLGDKIDRSLHLFLCFEEELNRVLFGIDIASGKPLGIYKTYKRGRSLLKGLFIKAGAIRIWQPVVLQEEGYIKFKNFEKLSKRQHH
jgi:hypothetical protein